MAPLTELNVTGPAAPATLMPPLTLPMTIVPLKSRASISPLTVLPSTPPCSALHRQIRRYELDAHTARRRHVDDQIGTFATIEIVRRFDLYRRRRAGRFERERLRHDRRACL